MKILEKFVLILYSFLILVISVVLCLVIFKIIDIETINNCIKYMLEDSTILITVLASSIVCILLSIRCLFFRKRKEIKKSDATDILLENESGRLLISKRAIENAVKNVVNNAVKDTKDCKVIVDIDPRESKAPGDGEVYGGDICFRGLRPLTDYRGYMGKRRVFF